MSGLHAEELYVDDDALAEIRRITMGAAFRPAPPSGKSMIRQRDGLAVIPSRPESAGLASFTELYRSTDPTLDQDEASAVLTHSVVEGARRELAGLHLLLDVETVEAATLALTGGEQVLDSLAAATVQLAGMEPREIQALALSSDVSAAERQALAKKGWALKDGSYPIGNVRHLHSAAVMAATGHGDVRSARKLIRKRAAELGVNVASLPGMSSGDDEDLREDGERDQGKRRRRGRRPFSDHGTDGQGGDMDTGGPSGDVAASRALMRRGDGSLTTIALTGAQEYELGLSADDEDDDHSYYVGLAAGEFGSRPAAAPFRVHDVGTVADGDPADSRSAAEIARLLNDPKNAHIFGEKPSGSSTSSKPTPYRDPGPSGKPQSWR